MKILAVVLGAGLLPDLPPPRPEDTRALQRVLDNRELDPITKPDRVETLALEDVLQMPANAFPSARPVVSVNLPGRFV